MALAKSSQARSGHIVNHQTRATQSQTKALGSRPSKLSTDHYFSISYCTCLTYSSAVVPNIRGCFTIRTLNNKKNSLLIYLFFILSSCLVLLYKDGVASLICISLYLRQQWSCCIERKRTTCFINRLWAPTVTKQWIKLALLFNYLPHISDDL